MQIGGASEGLANTTQWRTSHQGHARGRGDLFISKYGLDWLDNQDPRVPWSKENDYLVVVATWDLAFLRRQGVGSKVEAIGCSSASRDKGNLRQPPFSLIINIGPSTYSFAEIIGDNVTVVSRVAGSSSVKKPEYV